MADLPSFLLFARYEEEFERSERVVLPRKNPFEEYDEAKFRQRFRLSKFAVTKLLDEVHCRTLYIAYHYTLQNIIHRVDKVRVASLTTGSLGWWRNCQQRLCTSRYFTAWPGPARFRPCPVWWVLTASLFVARLKLKSGIGKCGPVWATGIVSKPSGYK